MKKNYNCFAECDENEKLLSLIAGLIGGLAIGLMLGLGIILV